MIGRFHGGWGAPLNLSVKIYDLKMLYDILISVLHNLGCFFIVYYKDQTWVSINNCWTHTALSRSLDALSLYSLLDHLKSLLQA